MTYSNAARQYLDLGWSAPIPLPAAKKAQPPGRKDKPSRPCTGNVPDVKQEWIDDWIETRDGNIGLRMQAIEGTDYETIGLDVDHHGDKKRGADTLAGLELQYGVLPTTWKSSSRGGETAHGIYLFKVPAGRKWKGQVGDHIETIQRTHRYMVVSPSHVPPENEGGGDYRWYRTDSGIPTTFPPKASQLPELPESWQKFLEKGRVVDRGEIVEDPELASVGGARAWLQRTLPGYNELPSGEMASAADEDTLVLEASVGAHEMLITRSHEIIMLAVEGHHGCKWALDLVETAFYNEVLGANDGQARRSMEDAASEFGRAIVREVEKVKYDLDNGLRLVATTSITSADEAEFAALPDSVDIAAQVAVEQVRVMRRQAEKRSQRVRMEDYADNDRGNAYMTMDYWNRSIMGIKGTPEFAQWDEEARRWGIVRPAEMTEAVHLAVEERVNRAADDAFEAGQRAERMGDEDTAKREYKLAKEYRGRAEASTNRAKLNNTLALAHDLPGYSISWETFDSNPNMLGVANGILDFSRRKPVGDDTSLLIEGEPEHYVSLNTGVFYDPDATSPLWESYLDTFLPDLEYRRFVRKALGYTLFGANPERLMIFLQGGTSTGKSTMLEAIKAALGKSYSAAVNVGAVFREKQDGGPNPELVSSLPKRVITASEIGSHHHLHPDVIKRMTGEDQLSARMLYSNEMIGRTPAFTPVIATNSMPSIRDGDTALWRRFLILPFDRTVPQGAPSIAKIETDTKAVEAVLRWLVDGMMDYRLEGLAKENWPSITTSRAAEFIAGTSDFQTFVDTHIARVPDSHVPTSKLYAIYKSWCASEGIPDRDHLTKSALTKSLAMNGMSVFTTSIYDKEKKKSSSVRCYRGIKLKGKES